MILFHLFFVTNYGAEIIFPVIGDFGGQEYFPYWASSQEPVAASMDQQCADHECDFFISIGNKLLLITVC
jgi:hypothetical protein